jgi:protein LTV1
MPKGWIDRKTADTYHVVHRSQEDPLSNDADAPQQVLVKVDNLNTKAKKIERKDKWRKPIYTGERLAQEAEEFAKQGRRENEGEAALYGINYDDSKYDYMQHLKPMGTDSSAVFIARKDLEKGKHRGKGELMLNADYAAANRLQLPADVLPSEEVVKRTYQDQQNIPDEISGFQPDMDENLREVLEALEDEEYIDDDEDFFSQIVTSGKKEEQSRDQQDWDNFEYDEDAADEYISDASDDTIKGSGLSRADVRKTLVKPKEGEAEWETAFRQFKIDQESSKPTAYDSDDDLNSEGADQVPSLADTSITRNARGVTGKKKKIGVKTDLTGFSMSSSALFRNEGLSLLDDRFDRIEEAYNDDEEDEDEDEEHAPFDMSKERDDLEAIMDDFLDNYVVEGKKMYKR